VGSIDTTADWEKANEIRFIYQSEFDEAILQEKIKQATDLFRERRQKRNEAQADAMSAVS
jgi:PAB1-binding protein PBP1